MLGNDKGKQNPFTLREEIISMMQMSGDEVDIEPMERTMIRRLFNFEETTAREVMMPLIDVVAIDQTATCAEAMHLATTESHNLIPVFSDRIDRIVGILDALELLGEDLSQGIKPYIKAVNYAPGSKSIQGLLLYMRKASDEIVLIVDEFGGA